MTVTDPELPWDDPAWLEASDNAWQRGLRHQQAWWRQKRLMSPAGPRLSGDRLVASMLPIGVGLTPNLMTDEAQAAADHALVDLADQSRPGLIQIDRLQRNLLSSQPLCFNLFGYLGAHPDTLLPWVRSLVPSAAEVAAVRLEWAPRDEKFGRSAFDAYIEYTTEAKTLGFVGVECKYAENLAQAQPKPAADKYKAPTRNGLWRDGAEAALDMSRLRQFWYNQLLTQRVAALPEYAEGVGVVVACSADSSAREVTELVRAQLTDPNSLRYSSIEELVAQVPGHHTWRRDFAERYLDFAPVRRLLGAADPRREPVSS